MKKSLLHMCSCILMFMVICISLILNTYADGRKMLFTEDFKSLQNWKSFYFPKKKPTVYTVEREGDKYCLRAESNASASALIYKVKFNVYEYPRVRWRWKVNNIYVKGDDGTKAGDDYPLRIYVAFEYAPENEGFFERVKNSLIKKIYGEYPPHSSLNYVWASKEHRERIIKSPFTSKAKIIILQQGSLNVGKWEDEDINIAGDYRRAFGKEPPPVAGIAIMNDSDNTGESSVSFLEYIEVYR